ncbi:MAG: aminotransferase class V-fold PLP-dependent enzyme [Trueperaceae bacterium]|nr:MAG: aminotransferase class V-fold PLP-dependent enzyme [Trueperaceae bacterium]
MSEGPKHRVETLAIHGGAGIDDATGAVTPPIHLSTTFVRGADGSYPKGFVYTRSDNPNRSALERLLAALEGGAAAAAFSSGSAAAGAVFRSLEPGDHVIVPVDMYHGIRKLLHGAYIPWGLELSTVDLTDLGALETALRPNTRLVWVETPSNPRLEITDIAAVAELAGSYGVRVVCDGTWSPPDLQPSLVLGADLVVHASTKYLSGHSDVLGGVVVSRKEDRFFERVRFLQQNEGAVPSPFDCWLTMRGIKTLPYRMRGHCANAQRVATFLAEHPSVECVHYPGLIDHPGHEIARRQMKAYGGMLSFEVRGGEEAAMGVAAKLGLITRATSLGGVESLIEHRASIEGPESLTPRNLLRLSVGLEHPEDLLADLEQALAG